MQTFYILPAFLFLKKEIFNKTLGVEYLQFIEDVSVLGTIISSFCPVYSLTSREKLKGK